MRQSLIGAWVLALLCQGGFVFAQSPGGVAGVEVVLAVADGAEPRVAVTDEGGRFVFENVGQPPATLRFSAGLASISRCVVSWTVESAQVTPEARKAKDPHWKKELTADDLRLGAIFDVDTGVAAARTSNLNLSKSNRSSGGTSDGGTRTIRGTVTTWPAARPAPPSGD